MGVSITVPIQFRGPIRVLGPIGGDVRPENESYALTAETRGVIGHWPKPDVHPDGYWRLSESEAQFIADACNEKMERERIQLGLEVQESQCRFGCDENREIEDTDDNVWPCPLHGDHAQGRKNDDLIGPNLVSGELLTGEAIYDLMLRVAQRAYGVARSSEKAAMTLDTLQKVVHAEMLPGSVKQEVLDESYQ